MLQGRKIGLKLWSTNDNYIDAARSLYERGLYDYIELYTVPGSYGTHANIWKSLKIPYTLHAPHFGHGVNFADATRKEFNLEIYKEVALFADLLDVSDIVFHPGMNGDIRESARQFNLIGDSRILIENKPFIAPLAQDLKCKGSTFEEIGFLLTETGLRLCLDVGHCFCSANSQGIASPMSYLKQFLSLSPMYFHLCDNDYRSAIDGHMHLGEGDYPIADILYLFPNNSSISLETNKRSHKDLNDFIDDMDYLKNVCSSLSLRIVNNSDRLFIFNLANSEEVRANSLNSAPISWEEHIQWFAKKMEEPEMFFLIHVKDKKAGYIRYEKNEEGLLYYSIAILPEFQHRGIGGNVLKITHDLIGKDTHGIIKKNNEKSIHAALHAGYQIYKETEDTIIFKFIENNAF